MERYVLMGMDGSGKSANLNLMKADPLFQEYAFAWVRWEPKLLKPLYKMVNRKTEKSGGDSELEKQPEASSKAISEQYKRKQKIKKVIFSNPVVSNLWIFAALLDYSVQFYGKYLRLKKEKAIIFDRYYYDLFVDQGLNIGYTPEQIANIIYRYAWLFPKVKKVLYIKADPVVCFSRKEDIPSMEYLRVRFDVYEKLCKNLKWVTIDGERPLEEVYRSVKSTVLK